MHSGSVPALKQNMSLFSIWNAQYEEDTSEDQRLLPAVGCTTQFQYIKPSDQEGYVQLAEMLWTDHWKTELGTGEEYREVKVVKSLQIYSRTRNRFKFK